MCFLWGIINLIKEQLIENRRKKDFRKAKIVLLNQSSMKVVHGTSLKAKQIHCHCG